jgi:hypothetical protein
MSARSQSRPSTTLSCRGLPGPRLDTMFTRTPTGPLRRLTDSALRFPAHPLGNPRCHCTDSVSDPESSAAAPRTGRFSSSLIGQYGWKRRLDQYRWKRRRSFRAWTESVFCCVKSDAHKSCAYTTRSVPWKTASTIHSVPSAPNRSGQERHRGSAVRARLIASRPSDHVAETWGRTLRARGRRARAFEPALQVLEHSLRRRQWRGPG